MATIAPTTAGSAAATGGRAVALLETPELTPRSVPPGTLHVDGDEPEVGRLVGLHEVEHGSLSRGAGSVLLPVEAKGLFGDTGQHPGLEVNRGDAERSGVRGAGDNDVQNAVGDAGFVHARLRGG